MKCWILLAFIFKWILKITSPKKKCFIENEVGYLRKLKPCLKLRQAVACGQDMQVMRCMTKFLGIA